MSNICKTPSKFEYFITPDDIKEFAKNWLGTDKIYIRGGEWTLYGSKRVFGIAILLKVDMDQHPTAIIDHRNNQIHFLDLEFSNTLNLVKEMYKFHGNNNLVYYSVDFERIFEDKITKDEVAAQLASINNKG